MNSAAINDPTECDCGRPKFGGSESCSRCAVLDGHCWSEARIISTLRLNSWLTLNEIGAMLGSSGNALQRPVYALFLAGRLRRQWRELEGKAGIGRGRYGGTVPCKTGTAGAWEYTLRSGR